MRKTTLGSKIMAVFIAALILFGMVPLYEIGADATSSPNTVADTATVEDWKSWFSENSNRYAGGACDFRRLGKKRGLRKGKRRARRSFLHFKRGRRVGSRYFEGQRRITGLPSHLRARFGASVEDGLSYLQAFHRTGH